MKQLLALLFCAVLLMTVACPVWAEESTTTDIVDTTTEPTESTTEPTESTTESTEPGESTTTAPPVRHAVFLTIAYENGSIVIRAKDVNGQPVRNAPVTVAADSEQFSGYTNDGGVATFAMATEPAQIICSTAAFKGSVLYYDAASASVILHTPTSATTTVPTTADTTTTQKPSTSYITGTSVTWTTSDPQQGNVTVTEIVTSTSYIEEEEEEGDLQPAPKKSALPEGWALALMIMGGVLLIVAAVVLCLFLFRAPRVPVKEEAEEEAPAPVPAPAPVEEPGEDAADETDEEPAEQPEEPGEDPTDDGAATAPKTVSLEDLFRNQ